MGDALIVGRGGSTSGGSSGKTLVTKIIQATQSWKVPKAKDQKFYVRIFGGGGGGGFGYTTYSGDYGYAGGCGGGGGMMNNTELTLEAGTSIPITIGLGGKAGTSSADSTSGGTTSFGTYLAANGGKSGLNDRSGGGDGGSGGGGGGCISSYGGNGYQFGGGGGSNSGYKRKHQPGGFGGYWGGAGGGSYSDSYSDYVHQKGGVICNSDGTVQYQDGSTYKPNTSGLGGNIGSNGINTIGNDQIPNGSEDKPYYELNLQGAGEYNSSVSPDTSIREVLAGGGYGGNGGIGPGGGGGGYGAHGGNYNHNAYGNAGGGGGGYGGNGGDGYALDASIPNGYYTYHTTVTCGGGGGGYGPSGTGGSRLTDYPDGGIAAGGAGGANNNSNTVFESIPAGKGGNGICIIQYYA